MLNLFNKKRKSNIPYSSLMGILGNNKDKYEYLKNNSLTCEEIWEMYKELPQDNYWKDFTDYSEVSDTTVKKEILKQKELDFKTCHKMLKIEANQEIRKSLSLISLERYPIITCPRLLKLSIKKFINYPNDEIFKHFLLIQAWASGTFLFPLLISFLTSISFLTTFSVSILLSNFIWYITKGLSAPWAKNTMENIKVFCLITFIGIPLIICFLPLILMAMSSVVFYLFNPEDDDYRYPFLP